MVDDVVVSVKTEVEKAESLVKLRENVARLGETSLEVNEGVDSLVESINAIAEAKEIAEDVASTTEAFNEQAEALTKAKEEYKRANEALLQFGDALSDIEKKEAEAVLKSHEKEVARLTKSYDKAEKAMTKANERYASASGYVKQLSTDSEFFQQELEKANEQQIALNESLSDMESLSFAKNDLGVKDLQKELDKLNESYETLEKSGKLTTSELELAHQRLTEETKKYRRQLDGTQGAINNLKKGVPSFVAVSASFAKMAKDAIDFQSSMVGVAKVLNGTEEDVKKLSDSIIEMSKKIPLAVTELAQIAEEGAKIGLAADDVERYTEQVAKMATAFDMSTEKSGKSVATMMTIFNTGLEGVAELSDAINHLSNSGASNAEDIIEILTRVGGSAQNFGLAKEEVAALAHSFLELGQSPEIASTSLKNFFVQLSTAEKQGSSFQESLEKMGMSSVELAQSIRDNPQRAIIDFLGSVNKLDDADVTGVLTDIFGRSTQADVASMARNVDGLSKAFGYVGDRAAFAGSVGAEFNKVSQTTESQLTLLKNNVNALSVQLGESLLPIINAGAEGLTGFVQSIQEFSKEYPNLTKISLALFALAGGARAATAGFKLMKIQGIKTTAALTTGFTALGASANTARVAALGLSASVGVLGAAFAGLQIGKYLRENFVIFEQFGILLAAGMRKLVVKVTGYARAIGRALKLDFSGAKEAIREMEEELLEVSDAMYDFMEETKKGSIKAREGVDGLANSVDNLDDKMDELRKKSMLESIARDGKTALARALANDEEAASIERLNHELNAYNMSYNSIMEGLTKSGNDALNRFRRIANESAVTSEILRDAMIATLDEISTPRELENLIEQFEMAKTKLDQTGESFLMASEDLEILGPSFARLTQLLKDGVISQADFNAEMEKEIEILKAKKDGLHAVTSEFEKQLDVINKQLKKEEELLQSKIDALKAERDLATAREDASQAAELTRQIASKELELIQAKLKASGKLTELESKELERLNAKVNAGEKLNDTEKKHLEALKHSIALRANEVAALGASAEAKAIDTQATDANTAALQRRNNAASGASKSIKKTAEAVDDVDKATKKTTSSGGGSTKFSSWLKDAGDTALLAQSQIDGLKNSVLGAQKYLVGGVQDIHGFVNANKHLRYEIEQLQKGVDRFKSLRDEISALKDPTLDQVLNFEAMANSINSIDDQALGVVKSQLQGMKDEILALRQESEQLLDSLKKEQAKAMGRDYRITQSQKLLEIEEKIAEAKAKGDMTAVRNLEEAMGIQQRIDRISYVKNRREEEPKITKRVAIDLNIGNEPHQMETDEQTAERVLRAIERKKRVSTRR